MRLSSLLVTAALLVTTVGCARQSGGEPLPSAQQMLTASVAVDPETGDVIAFGGQQRMGGQFGPSAATWRWNGDRWEPATAAPASAARSTALLAADPRDHGVLLFGGTTQTTIQTSCTPLPNSGQLCTGTASPVRTLSDSWEFTGGQWRRRAADGGIHQVGQLMASDPALNTVVLVGRSLAGTLRATPGTWRWNGSGWSEISATAPEAADGLGYDPVSHQLIAYGGQEPSTPGPTMGAPTAPGYSRTWAFTDTGWHELHPPAAPDHARATLTASPDGQRLMLINTPGQTWIWTGQDWQRFPTRGTATPSPWTGATLRAAASPSRHEVVLLATDDANDQTWTLQGDQWTLHAGTPWQSIMDG